VICGRLLAGTAGSNPAGGTDISCVCCVLSDRGCSLFQRSPTECGASEFDREALIMWRSWPTRGLLRHGKMNV
jgi:hypothetical protein